MKQFIILFTLIFTVPMLPEGFAADTKIKMEHGYVSIEHVFKGCKIINRSLKKYKLSTDTIFCTYKTRVPVFVCFEFHNHEIKCGLDQQFYIRATREWVSAQEIVSNKYIQNLFTQQTRLLSARVVQEPIDLYIFTTKKYHNFLVSFDDILVHNLEPFFASAGMAAVQLLAVAEGVTTAISSCNPWVIALGLLAAGGCTLYNWFTSHEQNKKYAKELQSFFDEQREKQLEKERTVVTLGSPGPQKDPDDKDKNKKYPFGRYEDAPYHHTNSKGRKNPCPIDGQKALDNSIEINGGVHRIAIENDSFVILRRTGDNLYHGHVRTWKELTHTMQNSLKNANKVTGKGKIIS